MNTRHWTGKLMSVVGAMAVSAALSGSMAMAQYGPPRDGDRGGYQGQGQYDDQHWGHGPDGYEDNYHEQGGRPMLGARQGWVAGMAQGQSDRDHGHSYRPTHVDTFKHVPGSPEGYSRDQFKQEYRDAFVKGYSRGYGR